MSIPIVEMIRRARREGWALGQFNLSNLETLQGIVAAANEERSPLLVGVSMGTIRHVTLEYLAGLMQGARDSAEVPIFFHLDHGPDLDMIRKVVAIGFDSVMLDTSRLPFEKNVASVVEAVNFAHDHGVGIEAQIGETWDEETGEEVQVETEPEEAREFVADTGIDYLAFSFGNTPGRLQGESNPDIALVREIAAVVSIPLVLHGGTSIPDAVVKEAVSLGAAKINIDTTIRRAVTETMRETYCDDNYSSDPRKQFALMRKRVKHAVRGKMRLFGSAGKA